MAQPPPICGKRKRRAVSPFLLYYLTIRCIRQGKASIKYQSKVFKLSAERLVQKTENRYNTNHEMDGSASSATPAGIWAGSSCRCRCFHSGDTPQALRASSPFRGACMEGEPLSHGACVRRAALCGRRHGRLYPGSAGRDHRHFFMKETLSCHTLITALGPIPEREPVRRLGDPDWPFLAGSCQRTHDLMESVSAGAERIGKEAST